MGYIEEREIWFWQVGRYLDDGWTINYYGMGSRWWSDIAPMIESRFRPLAIRVRSTGAD